MRYKFMFICLLVYLVVPIQRVAAHDTTTIVEANSFAPNNDFLIDPEHNQNWQPAGEITGGCEDNGVCDGGATTIQAGLYEYIPDAHGVDTDPNLNVDLSTHGGDPTPPGFGREICHIGNQSIGWASGVWHHGARWQLETDANGNRTWTGPLRVHWAFKHEDRCRITPTPVPTATPTATPLPTAPPGRLDVYVYACNQPFNTRIQRTDTNEGANQVSHYRFENIGWDEVVPIQASGYGDFEDTFSSGQANSTVRINMKRKPEAGPCGGDPPPPPPNATATPVIIPTATPGPPCTVITNTAMKVLDLAAPATGTRDDPMLVDKGVQTLHFTTLGDAGLNSGGEVNNTLIYLYDVTEGARKEIARSSWERMEQGSGLYMNYRLKEQTGFSNIVTSHGGGWHWKYGDLKLDTPALQPGHIYEIFVKFIKSRNCVSYQLLENSNYIQVSHPDINIQIREASLMGHDTGPRIGHPITIDGQAVGSTDDSGHFTYLLPQSEAATMAIQPNLPNELFLWKVGGDCTLDEHNLDLGTAWFERTGGCTAIFTYIPIPEVTGRAFVKDKGSSYLSPYYRGTLAIVSAGGNIVGREQIRGGGQTALTLDIPQLRSSVGDTSWSLSYSPPSEAAMWVQLPPKAGSAGDTLPDDLSITFMPSPSIDNQFFLERDPNEGPVINISGNIRLNSIEEGVKYGPYGTVRVRWGLLNKIDAPVATDGSWNAAIPRLGYTATLQLEYTKNLPRAAYDYAELGTVDGSVTGVITAANLMGQISMPLNSAGVNFNFVVSEIPPPPPPPIASGEIKLHIHSHLDPENGVYLTQDQTFAWPNGETLDFAPAVELDPLPESGIPGYRFEQRVVAWSFNSSLDMKATDIDALGRKGCRVKDAPLAADGDTSYLSGCVYRYRENPSPAQMSKQARIHWSLIKPYSLPDNVYSYHLHRFQATDIKLNILVETSVINTVTGERWDAPQILDGTFKVDLLTPRTTK